ncbi:diacylglycerol/lipid kinase family protein [Rubrobacter indicoceani]|uniref:diacylglycerol/lipid kinase family protein n=1 Tax=Rubrobacter indicoceani TaxID=2051957 RepID=UPI000E5AB95F|nr:diacylglycerol kinase family protein [Rubrobacter indicoceani]
METSGKRARVICNPNSGGGDYDPQSVKAELDQFDIEWIKTSQSGEACKLAREYKGGLLIVIGGDGTVNEVVNGLGQAGFPEDVTLAILPTGTGNDLAATLAVPEDPDLAEDAIRKGRVRKLDAARVRSEGKKEKFFINVATGGFGAAASGENDESMKSTWGKLSYLRATLEAARKFDARDTLLTLDGEERRIQAVNIVVGNCRYAGGGWLAAPVANPEDGLLDVVVIEPLGMKSMLGLAPAAFAEYDYLGTEGVFHARARSIRVYTEPEGLEFTADGEVIGDEPARFDIVPGALKVIVGDEYIAEPGG